MILRRAFFRRACYALILAFLGASAPSVLSQGAPAAGAGGRVQLAAAGKSVVPVIVSAGASARTRAAAQTLVGYLGRISGAQFEVKAGDGSAGLAVGLASDFPALGSLLQSPLDVKSPEAREDYFLRSHAQGLHAIGATEQAVEHAVWDLLYRLGYRQFFPGEHWEVIPSTPDLAIAVDTRERPAYQARRIWYGYGAWDYAAKPYADWCAKNRATSGIQLNTGHSYDGILKANKAVFDQHPEYLGLVGGQRKSTKFCISNPGLRQLVAEHMVRQIEKKAEVDSVSVDPSDGGGWCECDQCAKLGSVSDRAIILANAVAEAVTAKKPGTLVGLYAYNFHSPPPTVKAHPAVVVSVATAFIKGGQTVDELIEGWSAKATTLGIREYYSVNTWDRDQPAAARGGNIAYLNRTIPAFHAKGAKFMSAESSDNWGPNGLGYYLASRMLWDVKEASHVEALVNDFMSRAFGPAEQPMREFYKQLDGSEPHMLASDQLGRMFRALADARERSGSNAVVRARVNDLIEYAHYVDLFARYSKAQGTDRQSAFEALIRHAYQMRTTMLIHTKALYRDLAGRDKSVTIPPEAKWSVAEGKNPWKSSKPFIDEELAGFVTDGIHRYPLAKIDFKPIAYSEDLVSAAKLNLPADLPPGSLGPARGRQVFFTRVEKGPAEVKLLITGGLIAHYRDRGNVKVVAWKLGGASETGERETLAAQDRRAPPDGAEHAVTLTLKDPGVYRIAIDDGSDRTLIKWDCPLPVVVQSSADAPMNKNYTDPWLMYFYVPRGTKVIGLFGGEHGEIRDSAGRPVFWLNGREPGYFAVDVPDGQDGRLWSVRYGRGSVRLLTVPPYFARSAGELLLPAEVVNRDAAK